MGQSLNLSPHAVSRAFRAKFPRYRPELDDADLYRHLRDTYPEDVKLLVDPLLEGSEVLPAPPGGAYLPAPGDTAEAYRGHPLPTVRARGNPLTTGANIALRVVPPLAVGAATSLGALPTFGASVPAGMAATGATAAAAAGLARRAEEYLGLEAPPTPKQEAGLIASDVAFGAVPGLKLPAAVGPVVRAGLRATEGAGLSLAQQQTESLILDRPLTARDRAMAAGFGAAFGGGIGAYESRVVRQQFEAAAEQLRQRTLTRNGLAGTLARIAEDLEFQGVDQLAARRYAKSAARAIYQGREMPEPPRPEYPTEVRDVPVHSAEEVYLREAGWQVRPGETGDTVRQWYKRGGPPVPEPEPHGPYPQEVEAAADALGRSLEAPPREVGTPPRLVPPDAGQVTARPAVTPPPLAERRAFETAAERATRRAVSGAESFTQLDQTAVPAPRAGDVAPTRDESRAFAQGARQAAKQQVKVLAPPMAAPLGKPSAATSKRFEQLGARGVRQAVGTAPAFLRLDEPPRLSPELASRQGAAAVRALQEPGGSVARARQAARTTLPEPPAPPPAPATKDVVLVGEGGDPVGTVRVPESYDQPVISEAEYNSLYARQPEVVAPESPMERWWKDSGLLDLFERSEGRPGIPAEKNVTPTKLPPPLNPKGETGAFTLQSGSEPIDFRVPPGDVPQLRDWLRANKTEMGGQSFYRRAEQALARGNPTRAWQVVQAESLRRRPPAQASKARAFAELRGEAGSVREQVAGVRGTTRIPQPRPAKRPQFGQLTLRASGLKDVGHLPEPTTILALPPEIHSRILRAVDRARLGRIKGNQDTDYRLFRQVASQVLDRDPRVRSISRALGLTPEELAAGWTSQVTEAARLLQKLSRLTREIPNVVEEVAAKSGLPAPPGMKGVAQSLAGDLDADESLQKLYGGLFAVDPAEALAWVRRSAEAMHEVHAQHLLERQARRGPLAAFNDLRRAGLTGTIAAFWRNAAVGGVRWNAGILSDAVGAILSVDPTARRELAGRARDRLTAAPHLWNLVARPWASSIFEMWPKVATAALSGRDPRKTLRAITAFDDAEAHFLGLSQQDLPQSSGQRQYITLIQTANRAQEYPLRALAADLRMRQLVRRRGHDPNHVLNDGGDLAAVFGSPEAAERAVQDAVGYGLDFTFASDTLTGSINKALVDTINRHPMLAAIQSFPRYAWSAAPRFVWDHSPGILVDMALQTLSGGRLRIGQRFMRGQQVALASDMLGRRETRLHEISLDRGRLLQDRLALTKERVVLKRRLESLERKGDKGTITREEQVRLGELQVQMRATNNALNGQMTGLGRLQQEERILKDQVRKLEKGYTESAAAAAPESYGEAVGKVVVGLALWTAAHAIRSSQDQQDLPWYKIRAGDTVVDTRAFGPLTFYLFFGDLTASIGRDTDLGEYRQKLQEKVAAGENKVAASVAALRESYHGKYTEPQALREAAQLVFGLSPAGGVTAAMYDMLAPEGLTVDNLLESTLRVVGEWLAGPLQPLTDASNLLSMVDPGEAAIRDAGMLAPETPLAELAQPLTKIPIVKQAFPEQYSQTTGEVVAGERPALRTLGGITLSRPPNAVESVLQEAGVPGNKYLLPRLDDVGLTQELAKVHADSLRQMYDEFIRDNPDWTALRTPEERRTYLTMPQGPLAFARALTWATMQDYGEERIAALRESPARKAAAQRQLKLLERWSEGAQPEEPAEERTPPPGLGIPGRSPLSLPPPPRF